MDAAEVKKKVDRLAELDRQMAAVKVKWKRSKPGSRSRLRMISGTRRVKP